MAMVGVRPWLPLVPGQPSESVQLVLPLHADPVEIRTSEEALFQRDSERKELPLETAVALSNWAHQLAGNPSATECNSDSESHHS